MAKLQQWNQLPVVLSSPHSGTHYPTELLEQISVRYDDLKPLEDGPVDVLLSQASSCGAPLVSAHYSRAFIDANRGPNEIDPKIFPDWPSPDHSVATTRACVGLGLIPTHLGSLSIYRNPLLPKEVIRRLKLAYRPYHRSLASHLERTRERFGGAILLDVHSMPPIPNLRGQSPYVDVTLGDRYGRSCAAWLVDLIESSARRLGLKVTRNLPYAGGYITEFHGRPEMGVHALQLEIRRGLFMNERSHQTHSGLSDLQSWLHEVVMEISMLLSKRISRISSIHYALGAKGTFDKRLPLSHS